MKTRAMAREMSNYMRQVNPQLAAALIDERDQVGSEDPCFLIRLLVWGGAARAAGYGPGGSVGCLECSTCMGWLGDGCKQCPRVVAAQGGTGLGLV